MSHSGAPVDPCVFCLSKNHSGATAVWVQSGVTKHCQWAVSENLWKSNKEHKYYQVSAADQWSVSSTEENRNREKPCQVRIPSSHLVAADVKLANDRTLISQAPEYCIRNSTQNWLTDIPVRNFWLARRERYCSRNLIWASTEQLNNGRSVTHL